MRWTLLVVTAALGCGRFGYDPATDGAVAADAPDLDGDGEVPPGPVATCDQPMMLVDAGDTGGAAASFFAIDVAATTTGFAVAWQTSSGQTHVTSLAVTTDVDGPHLRVIDPDRGVTVKEGPMAIAALGDQVLLAVDDMFDPGIKLIPLDAVGADRGSISHLATVRAYGHDYLVADPGRDRFVVMAGNPGDSQAFVLGPDGAPVAGPDPMFPVTTESVAVRPFGAGYAAITGNASNCDVAVADAALTVDAASRQAISMTCHNASLVVAPGGAGVVAGWNCEDDMVWATGGDPAVALPPHHAVFGDASNVSSNPRLAPTSLGVWYLFRVAPDRVGRALLAGDSNPVPGTTPGILFTRPTLRAHDVVARDDAAYLFWLEVDPAGRTSIWVQRLCTP